MWWGTSQMVWRSGKQVHQLVGLLEHERGVWELGSVARTAPPLLVRTDQLMHLLIRSTISFGRCFPSSRECIGYGSAYYHI